MFGANSYLELPLKFWWMALFSYKTNSIHRFLGNPKDGIWYKYNCVLRITSLEMWITNPISCLDFKVRWRMRQNESEEILSFFITEIGCVCIVYFSDHFLRLEKVQDHFEIHGMKDFIRFSPIIGSIKILQGNR